LRQKEYQRINNFVFTKVYCTFASGETEMKNGIIIAKKFISSGLSVVPVDDKKLPIVPWKVFQSRLPMDHELSVFESERCTGVAVVCGPVSGGLEIIDVDSKYDITGDLFDRLLIEIPDYLRAKLVIAETKGGGYHLIYRTSVQEGNQKLAQRHATEEELRDKPGDKIRVLLETRGVGGYFLSQPSPGYKVVQNTLSEIPTLDNAEREFLIELSRCFNEVVIEQHKPKEVVVKEKDSSFSVSPFDDYNNRADIVDLLCQHGWTVEMTRGPKTFLRRPGTENRWSAEYDRDKNWFTVFSTSTEFESLKGYRPYMVYAVLNGLTDWSNVYSKLLDEGYGVRMNTPIKPKTIITEEVTEREDSSSFLGSWDESREELEDFISGKTKMGLTTGFKALDENWRIKPGTLVGFIASDNTGKTSVVLYFAMIASILHKWKYLLFIAENSRMSVLNTLVQYYCRKPIHETTVYERDQALTYIKAHFKFINVDKLYSYYELKTIAENLRKEWEFNCIFIDPYNALTQDSGNSHNYDYQVYSDMQVWAINSGLAIWVSMHLATNAVRQFDDEGYMKKPHKSQVEGGSKVGNKFGDLITLHRIANHRENDMRFVTGIWVEKVKETFTGGQQTPIDKPFQLIYRNKGSVFYDFNARTLKHPFESEAQDIDFEDIINNDNTTPF
jgi:hypothetical protein